MIRRLPFLLSVAALSFAALASGGCGDEAPVSGTRGPVFTTRDSASIEIVEARRDAWGEGEGWVLDDEPTVVLGAADDTREGLYQVRGAVRMSDGRIAVADAGAQQIRVFDGSGRFLRALGREGEGPGEFTSLFSLDRRRDTLVAHDLRGARLELFDGEGAFLGGVRLERVGGLPMRVIPLGDGGYVAKQWEHASEVAEDFRYTRVTARYGLYGATGAFLRDVTELPGQEMLNRGGVDGATSFMVSRSPLVANQASETVVGDRLVAGITDRFELRIFDPAGNLERLIRAPYRDRPLTGKEWDRIVEEEIARGDGSPEARRSVMELAELAPAPELRPAFAGFVGDPEGYVWVAPYRPDPGPTAPWLVVALKGPVLGTVELPHDFTPFEIGRDYVLGAARDELDVETVRLYGLTRPAATGGSRGETR